jgi:hypothetical protein
MSHTCPGCSKSYMWRGIAGLSMSVIGILITRPQRHRPGSRRLGGSWESCKVQAANQGDNATLLRLAEPMLNQATSNAQEFWGTSRNPGIRVSQSDNQILTLLASFVCMQITRMFVSRCGQQEGLYQRLLKMPQPVGGRTIKQGGKLVHPTGTSISKYRRNQISRTADSRQGMGGTILKIRKGHNSAPNIFLMPAS